MKLLKKFNEDCKAPQTLELKEGCRVMLLKNLDIKKGLANGSCGTVKQLTSSSIDILFDNGVRSNLIPMEFEYIKEDKLLIVKIIAEIDNHTTEKLRRKIDNEITRYMPRKVIFNFDKVSFMDSAGIGMIIGRYKIIKMLGGELEIKNVSRSIRKVFEMSGITKIIKLEEGEVYA